MRKRVTVGATVSALLLSGAMVGISYGGAATIDEPTEIVLRSGESLPGRDYPLRDTEGHKSGTIGALKERMIDADDATVGTLVWTCFKSVAWTCTNVLTLKAGAFTEAGSIVMTGRFKGFTGESLAVTGGTGAYANVRGQATLTYVDDAWTTTLSLLP